MGFFASGSAKSSKPVKGNPSVNLLHRLECKACPKNNAKVESPKMEPFGAKKPIVYMLGPSPDYYDDREGQMFAGRGGDLLKANIPHHWNKHIRYNNVVRTAALEPNSREMAEPSFTQIECCRPSIIRDIEKAKPSAIFGFGNVPLNWIIGQDGSFMWRGRKLPVKIGDHVCWYYQFSDLEQMASSENSWGRDKVEHMFGLDIARAFDELEYSPSTPEYHDRDEVEKNIHWVEGKPGDLQIVLKELKWFAKQDLVGIDLETKNKRPYNSDSKILTIALGTPEHSFAFPLYHRSARWTASDLKSIMAALETFLRHPHPLKVVHNLTFEMEWFAFHFGKDILRASSWGDSIQQAFLLNEVRGMLDLGTVTLECFGIDIKKLSNVDVKNLDDEPLPDVLRYNVIDAKYHALVFMKLHERITAAGLVDVYKMHMRRLAPVVLTQLKGIDLDQKQVGRFKKEYGTKLAEIEEQLFAIPELNKFKQIAGEQFDPAKNKHVLLLLNKVLGFKVSGTDEKVLRTIDHPFSKIQLEWRANSKLLSTYILPLATGGEFVYDDGKLHPNLNTVFAETGRLSSSGPNEQNFPKRKGKQIRRMIVPPKGHFIVPIDYGQIEARVIAMMSKDKVFVKALWENYDVHAEWARRIAHAYPRRIGGKRFLNDVEVMKLLRDDVKNQWTFPLFFGARLSRAAAELKVPEDVLSPLYDEFWRTFAGVKKWQGELDDFYEGHGYVTTLTGRHRRGPMTPNQYYNAPVQGTMVDIVMDAMDRISILGEEDDNLQPIMNVHDDLTFVWPEKELEYYAEIAVTEMLKVPFDFINVPINVELSAGPNWCDVEKMATYSSDDWFKKEEA